MGFGRISQETSPLILQTPCKSQETSPLILQTPCKSDTECHDDNLMCVASKCVQSTSAYHQAFSPVTEPRSSCCCRALVRAIIDHLAST